MNALLSFNLNAIVLYRAAGLAVGQTGPQARLPLCRPAGSSGFTVELAASVDASSAQGRLGTALGGTQPTAASRKLPEAMLPEPHPISSQMSSAHLGSWRDPN